MRGLHPRLLMLDTEFAPTPIESIKDQALADFGVSLCIKRDDLLHPIISGNKWRKLKYILNHALAIGADTVVSMGGAYSNHLHALAYAGRMLDLKTKAFIRGERPKILNSTLIDLLEFGMTLHFVPRDAYRRLRAYIDPLSLPGLKPGEYWLPEGGASSLALQGVAEMVAEIDPLPDVIVVACGTATTFAGVVLAVEGQCRVLGVAALKGAGYLNQDVERVIAGRSRPASGWQIALDYHHGGFAKTTPQLLRFIDRFEGLQGIPLEPVYTGKALYAIYDLISKHRFHAGQRILLIHTGGLQGNRSLQRGV